VFLNLLARQWPPATADVDLRLRSEPPARVADLACGTGWSSIAMAQAYPLIGVDGFDLDADAIQAARRNAGVRAKPFASPAVRRRGQWCRRRRVW
jgi:methylase of polypeptide subunit release factors